MRRQIRMKAIVIGGVVVIKRFKRRFLLFRIRFVRKRIIRQLIKSFAKSLSFIASGVVLPINDDDVKLLKHTLDIYDENLQDCEDYLKFYRNYITEYNAITKYTVFPNQVMTRGQFVEELTEYLLSQKYLGVDENSTEMTEEYEREHAWQLSRNCFINKVIADITK